MTRRAARLAAVALLALGALALRQYVANARTRHAAPQSVHITAKRFEYAPNEIRLRKGVPALLEITSEDREHGFRLRAFGVRAVVKPGEVTRVRFLPDRNGTFPFECDVFCGSGHEQMAGRLVVTD
jgi:cytochrome c oxidase subunit 2